MALKELYDQLLASQSKAKTGLFKSSPPTENTSLTSQIVDLILTEALNSRASDIHIEPMKSSLKIRYRIDGRLYNVLEIPNSAEITIIPRIKVLSNMQTDAMSSKKSMDGRFSFKKGTQEFDFRIATLPTLLGEKIAIRILNKDFTIIDLKKVGFDGADLDRLEQSVQRKSGLIIVCGPTGSGKTSTLYAILNRLHTQHVNIVTLEDPVEYQIDGINQCDVKKGGDGTFAAGLKSLLRQDPDVILIGEIRDSETAEIALRASITGHLVLTSLHANSAIGCVTRLLNMGLERYMVSYAVIGAVAQRLIPRLCTKCRVPYSVKRESLNRIYQRLGLTLDKPKAEVVPAPGSGIQLQTASSQEPTELTFYKSAGCAQCNNTGYVGRLGIFEVVNFDTKLRDAILRNASTLELENLARQIGCMSLAYDAMNKVKAGLITFEDVFPILLEKQ
jgi:type IV pilus assembly protein PilB